MKKILILLLSILFISIGFAENYIGETILVDIPKNENLDQKEEKWLPGYIQDKLKTNIQDYLGFTLIADETLRNQIKNDQKKFESEEFSEFDQIELGKLSTAKYACYSKVIKAGSTYSITCNLTDLITGKIKTSVNSSEYKNYEDLYSKKGAVDEVTLKLCKNLGITLSVGQEAELSNTSGRLDISKQKEIQKQNEERFNRKIKELEEQIKALAVSTDTDAIELKKKAEAEKAMYEEKQRVAAQREKELLEREKLAKEDEKKEQYRSIELIRQRDELAKKTAEKADKVRKAKIEKLSILNQISVIENKKKALLEIRSSVFNEGVEVYKQLLEDRDEIKTKVYEAPYNAAELENGKPTENALKRRTKKTMDELEKLQNAFYANIESIKKTAVKQDADLLAEILKDNEKLAVERKTSSLGTDLSVTFGEYSGEKKGWNAFISLYSDGILLYQTSVLINYESVVGKKIPDLAKMDEKGEKKYNEYLGNVDLYNSLFTRGDPVLYIELKYLVQSAVKERISSYDFTFHSIDVINTLTGKVVQTIPLEEVVQRDMAVKYDIYKVIKDVAQLEKDRLFRSRFVQLFNMTVSQIYNSIEREEIGKEVAANIGAGLLQLLCGTIPIGYGKITKEFPGGVSIQSINDEWLGKYMKEGDILLSFNDYTGADSILAEIKNIAFYAEPGDTIKFDKTGPSQKGFNHLTVKIPGRKVIEKIPISINTYMTSLFKE